MSAVLEELIISARRSGDLLREIVGELEKTSRQSGTDMIMMLQAEKYADEIDAALQPYGEPKSHQCAPPTASAMEEAWSVIGDTSGYTGSVEGGKLAVRIAAALTAAERRGAERMRERAMRVLDDLPADPHFGDFANAIDAIRRVPSIEEPQPNDPKPR